MMEPIAIIGMSCRFPGAKNPGEFWHLICNRVDTITEVPGDRWDIEALYDPNPGTQGKMNTRWGGFLEQIDQFDAQFFGIAPREAVYMDPQQRLLLEVAWEALEDAGQAVDQLAGTSTGVFVGISGSDYHQRLRNSYGEINAYMATGNAFSIAANRLSYLFDLRGPSMAIDTACSSSLVAGHLACQSLRSGESNLALAGGVNLLLSPELTIILSQAQMMSADGRCKTFDAKANGYVRGEGCGVVVLKRLADARRDGDNILALIRGSAINQDGRSNGLTAPNGLSQQALLQQAIANAGVKPAQIGYVEAHGTGTSLGDPIEAEALGAVLAIDRDGDRPCAIGSVKTNIGHLEAAAGIAGLIKLTLMLQHRKIPPVLHFQTPNPYIPFDQLPLQVQQTLEDWPEMAEPALAGVSSFGFGGANAHMILEAVAESYPLKQPRNIPDQNNPYLLPLSARSLEALKALAKDYWNYLRSSTASLADICHTASLRRSHHHQRLSLAFENREQLTDALEGFLQGEAVVGLSSGQKKPNRRQKLAFIFSGQGPQWWGMGQQLLAQEPVFRATIEQCDALLAPLAKWSLLAEFQAEASQSRLGETEVAQPAIFALQVGLANLWRSWGIEPSAVVGHSIGEVAAAHVAGALSLADAVQVVFHRGRLMQQGTGQGQMAAVQLSMSEAERLLAKYEGRLAIAAINAPNSLVLSGESVALAEVTRVLEQQQIFCKLLRVNYAFHSPQMAAYQAELARSLAGIQPQAASIPIISTVTGNPQEGGEFDAAYWACNIREPVQFATAIEHLLDSKHNLFVELSPHPILGLYISQYLRDRPQDGVVLPSLRRQESERLVMLGSLGSLYTSGYPVEWSKLYPAGGRCVALPTYPWQRQRYWLNEATEQPPQLTSQLIGREFTQEAKPMVFDRPEVIAEVPAAEWQVTRSQLLATPSGDRQQLLEGYLSGLLAKVMGLSSGKVDLDQPLYQLGLDSLMAVELIRRIEKDLEVTLPLEYFASLSVAQFVTQLLLIVEGKLFADPAAGGDRSSSQQNAHLWITRPHPRSQARLRLFCFAYAGAGASMFRAWSEDLPAEIEVCPIQLPGREDRFGEPPLTRLSTLIQRLVPLLDQELQIPFALFGHSLGGLICFELARELRKQNLPCPVHLLVSGCRAPQIPDLDLPIHRLDDPQFLEALRRLNGTPEEVLKNPELMRLFLPALRADFALLETYFYATQAPLACPISVFGGAQDSKVSQAQLAAWRDQTLADFTLTMFPGDHFFLHTAQPLLLPAIAEKISLSVAQVNGVNPLTLGASQ
jgi:acyl transferase domain-containing protein/surfactin synthase thioesterase subunit